MTIKINEDYTIKADRYNWIVITSYNGKDRGGNLKRQTRENYHPTLLRACQWIVDDSVKKCESVKKLIDKIEETQKILIDKISPIEPDVDKDA